MNQNEITITKFYTAFSKADVAKMCECYHPKIQFSDPAFGLLKGNDVCQMWKTLIERSEGNLNITFCDVKADDYIGSALWTATYRFSKTNRKVINNIHTSFQFQEGLIIKHTDDFDIWKWTRQALGWKGLLLGWTGYLQKKIQKQARQSLKIYDEISN